MRNNSKSKCTEYKNNISFSWYSMIDVAFEIHVHIYNATYFYTNVIWYLIFKYQLKILFLIKMCT